MLFLHSKNEHFHTMINKFEHIRPYNETEAVEAIGKLLANQEFVKILYHFRDVIDMDTIVDEAKKSRSIHQFHLAFSKPVLNYFLDKTTTKIVYSGIENVRFPQPHIFIANHRDIVLDSSILQNYFFNTGFQATKTAIGDNLISGVPFLTEFARLNKTFLVLRSATLHEKINNLHLLSDYINYSLFTENESVWIAQRNGRTKDGFDSTQQGLIKMLAICSKEPPLNYLKKVNLTPVTISYEYEPCDKLKAKELALSEEGEYIKQPQEDFNSIKQGILDYKGEVHLAIGKPVIEELDAIPHFLNNNDKLFEVCKLIDQQIYQNYHLTKNNYIAFDYQKQSAQFSGFYTEEDKAKFLQYLQQQSIVEDVSPEKMIHYLLEIYANPVKTKFGYPIEKKEDTD